MLEWLVGVLLRAVIPQLIMPLLYSVLLQVHPTKKSNPEDKT
jgi:hypothetical protein